MLNYMYGADEYGYPLYTTTPFLLLLVRTEEVATQLRERLNASRTVVGTVRTSYGSQKFDAVYIAFAPTAPTAPDALRWYSQTLPSLKNPDAAVKFIGDAQ